jgi:hypothetical protein
MPKMHCGTMKVLVQKNTFQHPPISTFRKTDLLRSPRSGVLRNYALFIAVFQFHTVDTIAAIHFNICKQLGELFHPIFFFPHAISSLAYLVEYKQMGPQILFRHPTSQLAGVLMQEGHPIAYESCKLNEAEQHYTIQEKTFSTVPYHKTSSFHAKQDCLCPFPFSILPPLLCSNRV